ncbi:MAG TPA: helix-turn-helix domain-containing protein [Chloroflexota bacterium]|nr:helix-turn-helix domain-containing protein [Chloroflexota bacterium]
MDQPGDALCPKFCRAVDILGRRWTCLILSILLEGPHRFSELEHAVNGIGGRMLSERLKVLEAHGIVERQAHAGAPARVEYRLTAKGQSLRPAIREIEVWADRWEPSLVVVDLATAAVY